MSRELAILRTACGCEREVTVNGGAHDYHVPMLRAPRFGVEPDPLTLVEFPSRRFEYRGVVNGRRLFVEVSEGVGVRPKAPAAPFTTGEWADAVARFARGVRGDIPQMDQEFLHRHDGGHIVQHESGVLVGAFYPSPGWEHSQDAVALFTALRQLAASRAPQP